MVTCITWDISRWGAENLSLATSDGSRLRHGGHNVSVPSIREWGNEGYVCNRDVPYLSVTLSYVDDDIRGLWKVPQSEPCHNPMALHMLTSSHVTDSDRFEKPVIRPVCWPPPWFSWLPRQAWPSTPGPVWQWPQHPREAAPPNLHPRRTIAHSPMLRSTSDLPGAHWMNCWQPRRADQRNHLGAEWDIESWEVNRDSAGKGGLTVTLRSPREPLESERWVAAEGAILFTKERQDRNEAMLIHPQQARESSTNAASACWMPRHCRQQSCASLEDR